MPKYNDVLARGILLVFPIETHITCDFPGGGVGPDPLSTPLDPHLNAHQSKHCIGGSTSRERERECVCVCVCVCERERERER